MVSVLSDKDIVTGQDKITTKRCYCKPVITMQLQFVGHVVRKRKFEYLTLNREQQSMRLSVVDIR